MKKILTSIVVALAVTSGFAAYASAAETVTPTYTGGTSNNAAGSVTGSYSTVLIQHNENADIVYIDQAATGGTLGTAFNFLLKENPSIGTYTVTFGNENGDNATGSFTISSAEAEGIEMDYIDAEKESDADTYKVAFKEDSVDVSTYKYIVISYKQNENTYSASLSIADLFGADVDGTCSFGVQVNDVPADVYESMTLTLSAQEVSE